MLHQSARYFLIAALVFVGSLLYFEWQKEEPIRKAQALAQNQSALVTPEMQAIKEIPLVPEQTNPIKPGQTTNQNPSVQTGQLGQPGQPGQAGQTTATAATASSEQNNLITVNTDVFEARINPLGGDVVYLKLKKYDSEEKEAQQRKGEISENNEKEGQNNNGFLLLDESAKRYYIAQSGLTGKEGPDSRTTGRAQYQSSSQAYTMAPDQDRLEVDLTTKTASGVNVTKQFVFLRNDYTIGISYLIDNPTKQNYSANFYGRLKRKVEKEASSSLFGVQTFTGAAVHLNETPYKKIPFSDIKEKPLTAEVSGGWAAMVEHYFLSAWIPAPGINYTYQTTLLDDHNYAIGFIGPEVNVAPNTQESIESKLYAGPQVQEILEKISPGLDLTVDYGILWPICKPIFWLLKKMFLLSHNWGVAIILTTIIIKALFYQLSASSYRSMGNMRKLQPRIEALKERYGEDKQKFSQAVMELYKSEKVNPLGGCLPILVQIPVFIALYYVLLGSVELRDAPFILWIQDLSAKDPYYVLPILMGLSMWLQQRMNPAPPDPVQAKVMMAMPILFTVLFMNFPSGLVLYWLVNNLLSILQQWFISRKVEATVPHGAK